ncbi:MAG: HIT domain-containing protein [bacterium]|nr:HIT domain-containing protein [bacterium]
MSKNSHINSIHSRRGKYAKLLKQIEQDGVCPLCPKYLSKYHQKPIIKTGKYWLLTENQNPYEGLKYHFLVIHKKHKVNLTDLKSTDFSDLLNLFSWATKKYKLPAGSILLRFGDGHYNGASVNHLHAHLMTGGPYKKGKKKIKIKVAYQK